MKFLENIKTILNVVVIPEDELSPDKSVIGDLFFKPEVKKFLIKGNRCCLMDIPEGTYKIIVGGSYYQEEAFSIETKSLVPEQPFFYISLIRKKTFSISSEPAILKGVIVDSDDKPISKAMIKITGMEEKATSGKDGSFSITFKSLDSDKKMILTISKSKYKTDQEVSLKKNGITEIGRIKLTRK